MRSLAFLSLNAPFFFAVALAGGCPITRRKQLQEIDLGEGTQMDFGTGYASSSVGQKERRRDAGVMQQNVADHLDHDAVKQLQLLEYMTAQLRSTHNGITTDQQVVMGQQVHA
jgi:hypothetical protein